MNLFNKMLYGDKNWTQGMAFKGGGSESTSTETSESKLSIDPRYEQDVSTAMGELRTQYESGSLSKVAGASSLQEEAWKAASGSSEIGLDAIKASRSTMDDAMNGEGQFAAVNVEDLERAAIDQAAKERGIMNDQFATGGAMGSSRQAIAAGDADAQLTNALAQTKYDQLNKQRENAMWGSDAMGASGVAESQTFGNNMATITQLGEQQRMVAQEELDADAKGLESYITGINSMKDLITTQTSTSKGESKSEKSGK